MSKFKYSSLVFVSNNVHKLEEFRAILNLPNLEMYTGPEIDAQDMNLETLTRRKIEAAWPLLQQTPFFVEHTGLIIDGWKGLPGPLIGQFMQTVGCEGICKMLETYEGRERRAIARTVIGYYYDKNRLIFEGKSFGTIAVKPVGNIAASWDWDRIFIPEGSKLTYAEMGPEAKNRISMRAKAALEFSKYLSDHVEFDVVVEDEKSDDAANEDIKRLIDYHQRRLQLLKEQEAVYGFSVDPSIKMEIEDIQKQIVELKIRLDK